MPGRNGPFIQQPPFPCNDPLLFVIPSVPGFPASLLSTTTTDVVLFKENHTLPTEAATLDRKSGGAEGSAVSFPPSAISGSTQSVPDETQHGLFCSAKSQTDSVKGPWQSLPQKPRCAS